MHRTIQDVLWLLPAVLQLGIVASILHKRLVREYPAFWCYLVLELLRTAVLFGIGNDNAHYATYFYSYWRTEVVSCLLEFAAIVEIFNKAFAKHLGLQRWGTFLLRTSLIVLVVIAVIVALRSPGSDANRMVAGILILKQAASFVQFGLIGALFAFVFGFGLPWSSYTIGIATGFAVEGAAEVVALAVRTHYGRIANAVLVWTVLAAGFSQVLVWAIYFLHRGPSRALRGLSMKSSNILYSEMDRITGAVRTVLER